MGRHPAERMDSKCTAVGTFQLSLSGCITSQYYAQIFAYTSDQIPFQLWTTDKTKSFTIECAKANAGGGPIDGDISYQLVTTVSPEQKALLDPKGNSVFHASKKIALPFACWRNYAYNDGSGVTLITVVRIKQGGSDGAIFTFDKAGLACMGQHMGLEANWFGWSNCQKKYINGGGTIRTVFLKAKAP